MKKTLIAVVLTIVLCLCAFGATFAWLMDSTETVTNTFTVGDINITLAEGEDLDLKMIPGKTITKDPVVTVKANSEKCYLFVKIVKSVNFTNFMEYEMADGWIALAGEEGVYYREVEMTDADKPFAIIKDNKVTVKDDVTKSMLEEAKNAAPTLAFTAYAVQHEGMADAAAAWTAANP